MGRRGRICGLPCIPLIYAAATMSALPRRWVVERTLAWLNRSRRLAKERTSRRRSPEPQPRALLQTDGTGQRWSFVNSIDTDTASNEWSIERSECRERSPNRVNRQAGGFGHREHSAAASDGKTLRLWSLSAREPVRLVRPQTGNGSQAD
jgi:hypothetical protein